MTATADLVLINPAVFDLYGPNMGLGYVAESARNSGFNVMLYDLNHNLHEMVANDERADLWKVRNSSYWTEDLYNKKTKIILRDELDKCVEAICSIKARYIGFFSSLTTSRNAVDIANRIYRRLGNERKIIFGGYDCHYRRVVDHKLSGVVSIDHVVVGEGERAVVDILQGFHERDRIIIGSAVERLDDNKWPTYAEIDWDTMPKRILIMGSRGCPWGRCSICPDKFGGMYRTRTGDSIFDEIYYHYHKNNIQAFSIADPVFNGSRSVVDTLCDRLIESDIKEISIDAQSSFVYEISPDLAEKLRRAGFTYIFFGLESGSQKIVDQMKKGFKLDKAVRTLRILNDAGIRAGVNILVGFPSETEKDFELTKQFLIENHNVISKVHENNHFRIYTTESDCGVNTVCENFASYGVDPETVSEENWISQNGRLDLQIRRRRVDEVYQVCDEFGIDKSYKTKD